MSFTLNHLDEVIDRSAMVAPEIDPNRTALLVLDAQKLIMEREGTGYCPSVAGAPSGEETIEPTERVVERCREEGIPVIWSLWGLRPDGWDAGPYALKWPPLNPGQPGSPVTWGHPHTEELAGNLQPQEGEPVIRKHRFSTFYNTSFDEYLRQYGIEYLVIAGVTCANCGHATAIDGCNRDYKVIMLADCSTSIPHPTAYTDSGADSEAEPPMGYGQHWEALRNIQMNYGDVLTSPEFFSKLDRANNKVGAGQA